MKKKFLELLQKIWKFIGSEAVRNILLAIIASVLLLPYLKPYARVLEGLKRTREVRIVNNQLSVKVANPKKERQGVIPVEIKNSSPIDVKVRNTCPIGVRMQNAVDVNLASVSGLKLIRSNYGHVGYEGEKTDLVQPIKWGKIKIDDAFPIDVEVKNVLPIGVEVKNIWPIDVKAK